MNKTIKAFTLGLAGAATALALNLATPTKADAGTCWIIPAGAVNVDGYYCHTQKRINSNGHIVWDVIDYKGDKFTLVFWTDNVVEVIGFTDRPARLSYNIDNDGDLRIEGRTGGQFAIRL